MTYKYALKILTALFVVWAVSLFTIFTEMQKRDTLTVDGLKLYEQALRKFRKVYEMRNNFTDPLATWQFVGPPNCNLSIKDKLSAVKNTEFPLGLNGKPVDLEDDIKGHLKMIIRKGWKDHCFNQFVSDLIPINRTLPDYRDECSQIKGVERTRRTGKKLAATLFNRQVFVLQMFYKELQPLHHVPHDIFKCKQRNYSNNLPEASIVICFHNEAWSVLLRTVASVLQRSPSHLVKEIILFDDFSSMDHLKENLENYIRILPKVTLIRANRRKGLIRARVLGARYASAPVVVFLDSHCECTPGWLEPLLDRVKKDPTIVVSPVVDHIDVTTFEYIPQSSKYLQIGGFEWDLKYIWRPVPKSISRNRIHPAAPIKTPTISGGLFAINNIFFKKIGYFDEGFRIWGGENLELSFKTWMCGGSLEIIPCSHVGHIFRKSFPYKFTKKSLRRNAIRLAEVWLDDYAKYYYQRIGGIREDFGDVTKRRELREKLKCKSFEWYLHNVYPDMKLPDENVAYGQIYNMGDYTACLDVSSVLINIQSAVSVQPCHFQGGNQFWWYTSKGRIEHDGMCLDYLFGFVTVYSCGDKTKSQVWLYDTKAKTIQHQQTQNCLSINASFGGMRLELDLYKCANLTTQEWNMENYNGVRLLAEFRKN